MYDTMGNRRRSGTGLLVQGIHMMHSKRETQGLGSQYETCPSALLVGLSRWSGGGHVRLPLLGVYYIRLYRHEYNVNINRHNPLEACRPKSWTSASQASSVH